MSATVTYSQKLFGTSATTSVAMLTGFSFTAGDTLLVMLVVPAVNGTLTGTSLVDNATPPNVYTLDNTVTGMDSSSTFYYYRSGKLTNFPTALSAILPSGSASATFEVVQVASLQASPFVATIANQSLNGGVSTITATIGTVTTVNVNDFVLLGFSTGNNRNLSSATGGLAVVAPETTASPMHVCYLADAGSPGIVPNLGITLSASASIRMNGVIYKSDKPVVTTIGSSATEGTALRFTLTMASDPGAITDYGYSWGGTAVNGTDYDGNLANATFSAGLSFTGGNIRYASGTTSGTIDVPTVDNALDQPDRTLILTVGGVASTGGLITDNDAPPVVTFTDGVESFGVVTCVATLGAVSGKDVSFQVDTTNGTKTAGTHYTAIVAQTVTIPAGSLTAAITVNTL